VTRGGPIASSTLRFGLAIARKETRPGSNFFWELKYGTLPLPQRFLMQSILEVHSKLRCGILMFSLSDQPEGGDGRWRERKMCNESKGVANHFFHNDWPSSIKNSPTVHIFVILP
jgi:hypothetical protein